MLIRLLNKLSLHLFLSLLSNDARRSAKLNSFNSNLKTSFASAFRRVKCKASDPRMFKVLCFDECRLKLLWIPMMRHGDREMLPKLSVGWIRVSSPVGWWFLLHGLVKVKVESSSSLCLKRKTFLSEGKALLSPKYWLKVGFAGWLQSGGKESRHLIGWTLSSILAKTSKKGTKFYLPAFSVSGKTVQSVTQSPFIAYWNRCKRKHEETVNNSEECQSKPVPFLYQTKLQIP